ncbi:MAG: IS630 family transposase [candidate division WOR-3 bacterium]
MPKSQDCHLNDQELQSIETAIRHDTRVEVRQRCIVIRLLHLGYKPEQVAEMQAVSKPTVYGWFKRWKQGGVEGLATKPRSGRPAKATPEYARLLAEVLDKEPQEFGYGFTVWTVERLRQHLEKETGIGLSESRLRALMKREGYRYRRPKNDLGHLQDKDAKAKAAEWLRELKKRSSETISSSSLWMKPR